MGRSFGREATSKTFSGPCQRGCLGCSVERATGPNAPLRGGLAQAQGSPGGCQGRLGFL